jgi:glyceraldehyde-3-phosphate dehydrogenase (NADP+)
VFFCEENSYLIDGELRRWEGKTHDVYSPIRRQGSDEPILIGRAPLQTGAEALAAVQAAAKVCICHLEN